MPKLKLFPRLYYNLVQRVLQSGIPAPRTPAAKPLTSCESPPPQSREVALAPHALSESAAHLRSKPTPHYMAAANPYSHFHQTSCLPQSPPGQRFQPFFQPSPYFTTSPYFAAASPTTASDQALMMAAAAQQAAFQQEALRRMQDDRQFYWQAMCLQRQATAAAANGFPSYPSDPRRIEKRNNTIQSCQQNSRQRLKLEKVVTTSRAPVSPFGAQNCSFVELLEMSQMDPDGYYKRICRTLMTSAAEIIDNLVFLPSEQPAT
eukprot:Protomagalhaensia_sp_Gyna_25__2381@NODE_2319_length_1147_cov_5_637184_g1922_i0_p1_GENE_NODE_2319_length_1147_cov_5_637184_g1922_i0NODE_2319_length_1147_cov_5_637184_g1922_i0_p1_ORF_typecomplete_len262_score40_13DUF1203/PF06718_11/0_043_NODE_2319_length_1147_cov_5_637184_g1922_i011796